MNQFLAADVKRVADAFTNAMGPLGFTAKVTFSEDSQRIGVQVVDPEDPTLNVAACVFTYQPPKNLNPSRRIKRPAQPAQDEIDRIAGEFAAICKTYPADKAEAVERAARFKAERAAARAAEDARLASIDKANAAARLEEPAEHGQQDA